MVRSIEIREGGKVEVVVSLTTAGCPIRNHFQQAVASNVARLDGVTEVGVGFDVLSDQERSNLQQALGRPGGLPEGALAAVKNIVCVASGKGGVGKSTMTANLAAALQAEGYSAGALDATSTATRSHGCWASTASPTSTPSARSFRRRTPPGSR